MKIVPQGHCGTDGTSPFVLTLESGSCPRNSALMATYGGVSPPSLQEEEGVRRGAEKEDICVCGTLWKKV